MIALSNDCHSRQGSGGRHTARRPKRTSRLLTVLVAWAALGSLQWFGPAGLAYGQGEPAADFVKRLRAAHYFDVAVAYLDRLEEFPGVDPELKGAVPLEKAQVFIDAAVAARSVSERDDAFRRAETELESFIEQGDHPRVAEARLQLGKLQMVRAAQLLAATADDQQREAARQSYLAAAETFDRIVEDLRQKLRDMRGQRIDAEEEPEKVALRDQYRAEFLQAQLRGGEARQRAAETFTDPAADGKPLLEEALKQFEELTDKYDSYVQGAQAILHRGQVQQILGRNREAGDSYLRLLEQSPVDALRESKFQAISGLIQLALINGSADGDAGIDLNSAIERGQAMVDDARPDEQRLPSLGRLRVDLAKAYLAKAEAEGEYPPADRKRARRSGRQLLLEAQKISGPHEADATELLAGLGVEKEQAAVPIVEDPQSLGEALESARQVLQASDALKQSLKVLEQRAEKSADVQKQIDDINAQLRRDLATGTQVLRRGLNLIDAETEMQQISQARQYLAYLLYEQQRYRETAVVGSFLARHSPGNERGLSGGLLALNSLQKLLAEQGSEVDPGLVAQVENLGEYLTETWPDDPEARAAQGVMVRLALRADRWSEARESIDAMPAGPEKASFQRLLGQLTWNRSVKAGQAGDQAEADRLLEAAERNLQAGLDGISGKLVDAQAMQAALILAKIHLRQNEPSQAVDVLDHSTYGPLQLVDQHEPPSPSFQTDLYRTELRAVVGQMTVTDSDTEALLKRATASMQRLKDSVTGQDAEDRLVGILLAMANDIRDQLDTASPSHQARLIDAFRLFLDRITSSSNDPATLQWAGQTLTEMGESVMRDGDRKASGQAAELLSSAVETFRHLAENTDDVPLTVRYQLGRAERLLGRYGDAIDQFEAVLKEKPMMLDAQSEAALAYEQWAAEVDARYRDKAYDAALNGARPNGQGENTIWGWGKISQLTSNDLKYRDQFFEARYHVALCRYLKGKALDSERVLQQAIRDITKVAALYPELGGPKQHQKFDRLLREIQNTAGEDPKGLPPSAP